MWSRGEKTTQRHAAHVPNAPMSMVSRTPMIEPMIPPKSAPSGMVPHTTNRTDAFMRPRRAGGQMLWRYETCAVL